MNLLQKIANYAMGKENYKDHRSGARVGTTLRVGFHGGRELSFITDGGYKTEDTVEAAAFSPDGGFDSLFVQGEGDDVVGHLTEEDAFRLVDKADREAGRLSSR